MGAVPQTIYWSTVGLRRYEIQTDVVFDSRLDLCVCNYFRLLPVFAAFANHRGEHLRGVCSIIVTQGGGGGVRQFCLPGYSNSQISNIGHGTYTVNRSHITVNVFVT